MVKIYICYSRYGINR